MKTDLLFKIFFKNLFYYKYFFGDLLVTSRNTFSCQLSILGSWGWAEEAGNDTNVKTGFLFKILSFYPDKIPLGTEWKSELCYVLQLIDLAENSLLGGIRKKPIFFPPSFHTHFGYWISKWWRFMVFRQSCTVLPKQKFGLSGFVRPSSNKSCNHTLSELRVKDLIYFMRLLENLIEEK